MNRQLIEKIHKTYPDVSIVMASKYVDKEALHQFLDAGIYQFGESRVESFIEKLETFKALDVEKHFLGTLQTKKVKKIINDIDVLHSLDKEKLAKEIQKRRKRVLPCFIQVNISQEPQKHGVSPDELGTFLKMLKQYDKIKPVGLMGMGELSNDEEVIREQFQTLRALKETYSKTYSALKYLSMGMSNDYHIALEVGSTHLRLGRVLLDGGQNEEK